MASLNGIVFQWLQRIGITDASQAKLAAMGMSTPQDLMELGDEQFAEATLTEDESRRLKQLVERVREAARQGQQKRAQAMQAESAVAHARRRPGLVGDTEYQLIVVKNARGAGVASLCGSLARLSRADDVGIGRSVRR